MFEYILAAAVIVQFIYLFIRNNKMATSLEQLQLRITNAVTELNAIKTEVTAMKQQTITQQEVNTEMDKIDTKITEIQQIINPA